MVVGQHELEDEVVDGGEPAGEAPPQGEAEASSKGGLLLRGEDGGERKDVAAVDWALHLVAVLVEGVPAGGDDWEDVGGPQLGGIGEKAGRKQIWTETVPVAGGTNSWAQVRGLPIHH